MKISAIVFWLVAALLLAAGVFVLRASFADVAANESAPTEKQYATLDASLAEFIADFNAAAGSVRMVFVAGPSCGPCLRGLDDMNRVLGDRTRTDPDLKAFVLYVPTLGAEEHHAARAVRLMQGADIRHYWDPQGGSGRKIQEALGIDMYAWDVWLVYDRNALWAEDHPPAPAYWEHQLSGLSRDNFLNPERFAKRVDALLDKEASDG